MCIELSYVVCIMVCIELSLCFAGIDVTKLFRSDYDHGVEEFLRDMRMSRFHAYLRDYMDHGDCGRRNCSTCGSHQYCTSMYPRIVCAGVGSVMANARTTGSYAVLSLVLSFPLLGTHC